MNCKEMEELLSEASSDEIPASTHHDMQEHLEHCADCRGQAYITQLEEEVLHDSPIVPLISPDFVQRTMQLLPQDLYAPKAETKPAAISSSNRKPKHYQKYLSLAASLALVFGAGFYLQQENQSAEKSAPMIVAEETESIAPLSAPLPMDPMDSEDSTPIEEEKSTSGSLESIPVTEPEVTPDIPEETPATEVPVTMKPAAYDVSTSATPNLFLASQDQQATEPEPSENPYRYAPASSYTSAIDTSYQTSRSGGNSGNTESVESVAEASSSSLPNILLAGVPESLRLTDFSCNDSHSVFFYQEDGSSNQFTFIVTLYESSADWVDYSESNGTVERLITCGDITYQVALSSSLPEENLEQIIEGITVQSQ
jgi:hypothetical protein